MRIDGRVLHKSDVAGVEPTPYRRGLVLALDLDSFSALTGRSVPIETRRQRHTVSELAYRDHVDQLVQLGADGTFSLDIAPGPVVLCVANLANTYRETLTFPLVVPGCQALELNDSLVVVEVIASEVAVSWSHTSSHLPNCRRSIQ